MLTGFALVIAASLFQGSFILPMTLVRKWRWEQTWITFSILGMVLFNWALGLLGVTNLLPVLASMPMRSAVILALLGAGWGVGAILFGLAMDRLGMSLGYPIIMGLIAGLGALIPMALFFPGSLLAAKGIVLLAAIVLAVVGIVFCSIGGARRQPTGHSRGVDTVGLLIAVLAGVLSCLPNVGLSFAGKLPSNVVWVVLFTAGGLVNAAYCVWLIVMRGPGPRFFSTEAPRNLMLSATMAALWIGSFYLYGNGASRLGAWGVLAGWPLFITLSIMAGVMWGLYKGEWNGAPAGATRARNLGVAGLFLAVAAVASSNFF